MAEPTECQTAICRFVVRQFTHHLALRARVRQHVNEIKHHDIQRRLYPFQLPDNTLAEITLVDFPIIECFPPAIAVKQRLYQFFLILVFTLFVPFFHPILRVHLLDLQRQ